MTEKQRYLIYIKLGAMMADIRRDRDMGICESIKILLEKGIIQKLEDLETGYYLESSAYLAEVFQLNK